MSLGLTYEANGRASRIRAPRITAEILRTKMMPEYTIPTRLPGITDVGNGPVLHEGYSAPGVLKPGWTQPHCIAAPCPPIYTGNGLKVTEIKTPNGTTATVATDENGDVVAVEEKPNWLPALLAGAGLWFFLM